MGRLRINARIWAENGHLFPISDPVRELSLSSCRNQEAFDLPKRINKERLLESEDKFGFKWKSLRTRDISPPKDDLPN